MKKSLGCFFTSHEQSVAAFMILMLVGFPTSARTSQLQPSQLQPAHESVNQSATDMPNNQVAMLPNFTAVVDAVGDSVVNIVTIKREGKRLIPEGLREEIEDTPLMDVLKEMFGSQIEDKLSGKSPGLGSGSIVSKDGYIITNLHVIDGADEIYVRLNDRREFAATVIGKDDGTDLALLKINANNLVPLVYAPENHIRVGEWVVAIGSPYGFEHTVTVGVISATGRSLGAERYVPFIQTDVAINPGNSGGGLFNMRGELVGINSQIISESGSFAGLSFAVPSQVIKSVIEQLKTSGSVERGWMGLAFQDLTRDLAQSFGIEKVQGALVAKVIEGSPAETAGIQVGDVITKFNNKDVVKASDLPPLLGVLPIDSQVKVTLIRHKQEKNITMQIKSFQRQFVQSRFAETLARSAPASSGRPRGIFVRKLEDFEKTSLEPGQDGVMVVQVVDEGWADSGIRRGDVILSLNHEAVLDPDTFYRVLDKTHLPVIPVLVTRAGEIQKFIPVKQNEK